MRSAVLWSAVLWSAVLVASSSSQANAQATSEASSATVDGSAATLQPLTAAQAQALANLARRLHLLPPNCVPFVQTKHLRSLPHALQFRGDLSVANDGTIRWRLVQPLTVEYLFSARGAWRRPTSTATWESLALSGGASTATFRVLAALVNLDASALQKYFVVSYNDGVPVRVAAVPKDARLRAVIERAVVEVAIAGAAARVERVELREANGDWSQFRFDIASGSAAPDASVGVTKADAAQVGSVQAGATAIDDQRCPAVPVAP